MSELRMLSLAAAIAALVAYYSFQFYRFVIRSACGFLGAKPVFTSVGFGTGAGSQQGLGQLHDQPVLHRVGGFPDLPNVPPDRPGDGTTAIASERPARRQWPLQ
jgi:hypothetical protein